MRDFAPNPTPVQQLLLVLLRSFRLGQLRGVEVRVYWAALLLPLLFTRWVGEVGSVGLQFLLGALQFVALFAVILSHELGHVVWARRHGIPTHTITLGPLGGLAHLSAPAPSPRAELEIALAGPAVHLLWLVALWPVAWLAPAGTDAYTVPFWHLVWYLKVTNLSLLAFNLLPVFPLDGGRVLRALLSMRWHPNRVTLWVTSGGVAGGALLAVLALGRGDVAGTLGLLVGLLCITSSLQERRLARHVPVYSWLPIPAPWAQDPDAWRSGSRREPGPGWFQRWRAARAERRAALLRAERERLDAEVDAILAKVHAVGMTGLTERERATLRRAAELRQNAS